MELFAISQTKLTNQLQLPILPSKSRFNTFKTTEFLGPSLYFNGGKNFQNQKRKNSLFSRVTAITSATNELRRTTNVEIIPFLTATNVKIIPFLTATALFLGFADKLPGKLGPLAIMRILGLFWGCVNQITTAEEAKRFYPLFGRGAKVAQMYFSNMRKNLGPGVDGWATSLKAMMSIVVVMGPPICLYYWWVNKFVLLPSRGKKNKKEKVKMGMMERLNVLVSSRYIRDLATVVLAYGISINLIEFLSPNEYSSFMGDFSIATKITTFAMTLLSQWIVDKYGWGVAVEVTPTILTGVGFFSLILFGNPLAPTLAKFGMTPLLAAVFVGAMQNKNTKYSLFDPCKEMVYIPLEEDTKKCFEISMTSKSTTSQKYLLFKPRGLPSKPPRGSQGSKRSLTVRCSICHRFGHNKRTCQRALVGGNNNGHGGQGGVEVEASNQPSSQGPATRKNEVDGTATATTAGVASVGRGTRGRGTRGRGGRGTRGRGGRGTRGRGGSTSALSTQS